MSKGIIEVGAMKKTVIRLSGGLGNQMFQYALGRQLEKEDVNVTYDTFIYWRDKLRKYELNHFHTDVRLASGVRKCFYLCCYYMERKLKMRMMVTKLLGEHHEKSLFGYEDNLIQYRYLDGYWQNTKYFCNMKAQLQQDFVWKGRFNDTQEKIMRDMQGRESVMIHIRRGDYLKPSNAEMYVVQDQDYYERAMHLMTEHVKEPQWYVFSDDIAWCKTLTCFQTNVTFVDSSISDSMYVDFELMKQCRHFIIGNSTFSWWAAWLAVNEKKVMMAPEKWYYDEKLNVSVQKALLREFMLV